MVHLHNRCRKTTASLFFKTKDGFGFCFFLFSVLFALTKKRWGGEGEHHNRMQATVSHLQDRVLMQEPHIQRVVAR